MKKLINSILLALVMLFAINAEAVQLLKVSPDPVQVPLAIDSETVVEFPEGVVKVIVPGGDVPYDFIPPFGNIIVFQVPERKRKRLLKHPNTYSLSVVTKKRIQQIILVPRPGISERIKFTVKQKAKQLSPFTDSTSVDVSWLAEPYNRLIRKLVKALYDDIPPKGYRYAKATSDFRASNDNRKSSLLYYEPAQFTQDYRMDLAAVVASNKVVARKYVVSNLVNEPIHLNEQAFWKEGCIAVAIRRHRLLPRTPTTERTGQYQTQVFIIAKAASAPIGPLNAAAGAPVHGGLK